MRILFDQGTPVPLRRHLPPNSTDTANEKGWGNISNGDLLAIAESSGYDLLVTTDQNLRYQQNLSDRKIAIVVLLRPSWPEIKFRVDEIIPHILGASAGAYTEI